MNRGWFKTWRKAEDSFVWKNKNVWILWSWFFFRVTHKRITVHVGYQQVTLEPGQLIFGLNKAAEGTGLSLGVIRRSLKSLEIAENIAIKTTNKYSIITILNWDIYQCEQQTNDNQNDKQRTNNEQTNDNKQEVKEVKKHTQPQARDFFSNSTDGTESVMSSSYETVLRVYREVTGKSGHDRNTKEGARELALAMDSGNLNDVQLRKIIKNGISDEKLQNQSLRGISNNYEKYLDSEKKVEERTLLYECIDCRTVVKVPWVQGMPTVYSCMCKSCGGNIERIKNGIR